HLALRPFRRNSHTTLVIRFGLSRQNSFNLTELATHFIYHVPCRTSHRIHRQAAEQESHHRTEKHARKDFRIHQIHLIIIHEVDKRRMRHTDSLPVRESQIRMSETSQSDAYLLNVRCKQSQPRQCGGTNRKTFSGRSSRVSERI